MFLKRALSFTPKFNGFSAWHLHKAFACELIFRLKPKCFVELGVHHGDSYFAFCQSVKENNLPTICYGIDHWEGDNNAGKYTKDVYESVISYNHLNYSNFSYLIKDDFNNASTQFCDQSIDLCHIDGNHSYECVSNDWETWKLKMKRDGIILFHDILEKKTGFGVWKLWEELKNEYPTFTFKFGSGLGVLQLSKSANDISINSDFILSHEDEEDINKLFLFCEKTKLLNLENQVNDFKKANQNLFDENLSLKSFRDNELKLQEEIHSLRNSVNQARSKCHAYQNSFSWKITMPLRFLRRMFVDPFRKDLTNNKISLKSYRNWINLYDADHKIEEKYLNSLSKVDSSIKFSIILPVYDPPVKLLSECIESVMSQLYDNWELCIVDDNSENPLILNLLENYSRTDSRIRFLRNKSNKHISLASNRACSFATGDYFVFLDHDDLLRKHSLIECFFAIQNNKNAQVIYSDEDKIDVNGNRSDPYFKPDWNPLLLTAQNFLCHLLVIKRNLFYKAGSFRKGYEGSQDWDLILRATKWCSDETIIHIPKILYHWRVHDNSVSSSVDNKSYATSSAVKAIDSYFKDTTGFSHCTIVNQQYCRINFSKNIISRGDHVSIIIPTKNNSIILEKCINSIFKYTKNIPFEILIINNASSDVETINVFKKLNERSESVQIIDYEKEFNFSAINNFAVTKSSYENLLFLNDDTEVINEEWLFELICHLKDRRNGAVGPKLYYPNGNIQHCGVLVGYCGIAGELYKGKEGTHPGQMQRANLLQNVSAITGACMAIRRSAFLEVGGFDEINLPIAFNDIDLCLKLLEKGYRNVFTPYSNLIHHESYSRGSDLTDNRKAAFKSECDYMKTRWIQKMRKDEAYNPNLSLESNEQFELSFPPRIEL